MFIGSGNIRRDLISGGLLVIFGAALVFWKWRDSQALDRRFDAEGDVVAGAVTDKHARERDDGSRYYVLDVSYRPNVGGEAGATDALGRATGPVYAAEPMVMREVYDAHEIGATIDVTYLPDDPAKARVAGTPPPHERLDYIAAGCAAVGLLLFLIGLSMKPRAATRST